MPPTTPPTNPTPTPPPKPPRRVNYGAVSSKASNAAKVVALLAFVLVAGAGIGYLMFATRPKQAQTEAPKVQTLSDEDIKKLSQVGASLGTSNQILTIGANSVFQSKVQVAGDLTLGGKLNANGPVQVSSLTISGDSTVGGLTVASNLGVNGNLLVNGTTTLQKDLNVQGLLGVDGGLNVSGAASVGSLNASAVSTRSITVSGPLTIGHLATVGLPPSISAGTAVGGGGTVNISGNDTAGTININTGNNPPAGVLATVVFKAAYPAQVHVVISPLTGAAAALPAYLTRTPTGFQIHSDAAPVAGAIFSYDYIVTQ